MAIPTPGHTGGHCSYVVDGVLVSGDALVTGHPVAPRSGPQLLPELFNHDQDGCVRSLAALGMLDTDVLLPGHGPVWRGPIREAVEQAAQSTRTRSECIVIGGEPMAFGIRGRPLRRLPSALPRGAHRRNWLRMKACVPSTSVDIENGGQPLHRRGLLDELRADGAPAASVGGLGARVRRAAPAMHRFDHRRVDLRLGDGTASGCVYRAVALGERLRSPAGRSR